MSVSLVITFRRPRSRRARQRRLRRVAAYGGTWLESRLARLAGQFAGVVRAIAPEDRAEALEAALRALPASPSR